MRVTISSSSRDAIDDLFKDESRKTVVYLADLGCELNWGSGKFGIMGICYEEFEKRKNKIHGYTTEKYVFELDDLPNADHDIFADTFDLKQHIFEDGDVILCLPGGTGTVSEFFSYLEEIGSNDQTKELIVCNYNGWFNAVIDSINDSIRNRFNDESIFNYFKVVNNFDEFVTVFEEIKNQFSR